MFRNGIPVSFGKKLNENRISAFQGTTENINRKNRKERKSHNRRYATFLFPLCRKGSRSFRFVGITSPQHPLSAVQVVRRAIRRSAGSRSYYPRGLCSDSEPDRIRAGEEASLCALRPNTEGKQGFTEQARTGFRGDEKRKKACEGTDRHARPHTPRLHKTLPAGTDGSRRGGKKGGDPDARPVVGKDRGSRTEDPNACRREFRAPERKRRGAGGMEFRGTQSERRAETGILTAKVRQQEPKRRTGQMSEQEAGGKEDGTDTENGDRREPDRTKRKSPPIARRTLEEAATYSPTCYCSTIGVNGLNFSVRNGKRWNPIAITT